MFIIICQIYLYNYIGDGMLIKYSSKDVENLARLIRAEAVGEGNLGMLMVGNVGVNRVLADCLDFKNIRNISQMINQNPGGFSSITSSLFYSNPTTKLKQLAERALRGEYFYPATNALWFYSSNANCNSTWFNQKLAGRYKKHCFYEPNEGVCKSLH